MKKAFLTLLALLIISFSYSQDLKGKWIGYFKFNGEVNENEFVIEFFENKGKLEALTHTKYKIKNQQYQSVCRAKVQLIKDSSFSKIIVTEYRVDKKSNSGSFRTCFQKHTLLFKNDGKTESLSGYWTSSDEYGSCGKGKTILTRSKE
jgi:hypothetical protein